MINNECRNKIVANCPNLTFVINVDYLEYASQPYSKFRNLKKIHFNVFFYKTIQNIFILAKPLF